MNYLSALAKLNGKSSRKIGNNTYLRLNSDGSIALRLHQTDILTFFPPNSGMKDFIRVNNGGYSTVTTKSRLNEYLPPGYSIFQKDFSWNWSLRINGETKTSLFLNGDFIGADEVGVHSSESAKVIFASIPSLTPSE